jgi:hypothetical protein
MALASSSVAVVVITASKAIFLNLLFLGPQTIYSTAACLYLVLPAQEKWPPAAGLEAYLPYL